MRAIHEVWPKTKIQRCLYHIQREGMRWLRTYPKTEAGRELRVLLKTLYRIQTIKEKDLFIVSYARWLGKYRDFVRALPRSEVAFKDLNEIRAVSSAAEHRSYKPGVTGSNPVPPIVLFSIPDPEKTLSLSPSISRNH